MKRITHSLVGYDRQTEQIAEEFVVPDALLPRAKELAEVPDDDPDALMCYPLDRSRAQALADMLDASIDTERRDYFLEGFAGAQYEFAQDGKFRQEPGSYDWAAWIHNDAEKDHVKVTVSRTTLDNYAAGRDAHMVVDLLNARLEGPVQDFLNRAINDGRAAAGRIELSERDLGAMLDGLGV